eukprot:GHVQ01002653.1.p1 GENE.GHVQ01002653.1~~GHVQ01002653.1.p1  ORF type:complete len:269 (+),score=31.18 GHVQ01002653.1:87-893(+)
MSLPRIGFHFLLSVLSIPIVASHSMPHPHTQYNNNNNNNNMVSNMIHHSTGYVNPNSYRSSSSSSQSNTHVDYTTTAALHTRQLAGTGIWKYADRMKAPLNGMFVDNSLFLFLSRPNNRKEIVKRLKCQRKNVKTLVNPSVDVRKKQRELYSFVVFIMVCLMVLILPLVFTTILSDLRSRTVDKTLLISFALLVFQSHLSLAVRCAKGNKGTAYLIAATLNAVVALSSVLKRWKTLRSQFSSSTITVGTLIGVSACQSIIYWRLKQAI